MEPKSFKEFLGTFNFVPIQENGLYITIYANRPITFIACTGRFCIEFTARVNNILEYKTIGFSSLEEAQENLYKNYYVTPKAKINTEGNSARLKESMPARELIEAISN